ncbi:serine/threonine-protein kinase ripk4 [Theileria orientalis strain Shintoku]|uniref:Serine/threonine-protein kinase ripk4 n=1 Tax=Theileria orientalis strain Shintoku TaxID=869250 RepID=J4DPP6_THEOR|nr:serine/threonine-protein kinase ripk4 [Theileria orientalis strain Shintoku]BAM41069.1 serine/threonine-protein kinase ripk4 [Theileria orientalis strain Shintoku]|eukprot:XP_009691370.1 serine/threonine-protein kinase ripk4 [Theileria orientalis strain Shintoku]
MDVETVCRDFVFSLKNDNTVPFDMYTLIDAHTRGLLEDKLDFPDDKLDILYEEYASNYTNDERVYDVFASCFVNRGMWRRARSALLSRLYFLEKDSEEYKSATKKLNLVEENVVSELIPLPSSMVERLFLREHEYNFKSWRSKMYHTQVLAPHTYGTLNQKNTFVSISSTTLKSGVLLFKTTPVAVAPWAIKPTGQTDANMCKGRVYCCFHCLALVNKPCDNTREDRRLVACPKHPRECNYFFCSKECFLKNGAVHSMECEHLIKLQKFSEYYLNPAIVLLVSRVLIKCRLNMDSTSRVCELDEERGATTELLDSLLNYYVDYSFLRLHHPRVLDEVNRFASFLLDTLGFDFCLHLTTRELAHITTVVWITSVPFTSYLNYSTESEDVTGGTLFTFKILQFKQSHAPNCVAHFDEGKLTVRSIYEIAPGTELTISTFLDKYLPPFIQTRRFWSVGSLFSAQQNEKLSTNAKFNDLTSIRCRKCINSYCYTKGYTASEYVNYQWECDQCSYPDADELDLLQNKAEHLFSKAQKLYFEGEFLQSKNRLLEFVSNWAGVLHPAHYLMYNAYLMLAGMLMNKPGGNIHESLVYLRKALIQAERMLPIVCHEKAYLYDRLADYVLRVKGCTRLKSAEYNQTKQLIMSSLYNCVWNWTVISGTDSYQAKSAMQKCRSVAFSLNIHTFPLSKEFVINVPSKYSVLFRAATGSKLSETYSVDDVASMAFCAAQSGEYDAIVLDILTTIQAYGIHQLGTGLSVVGIIASNFNLDFLSAMLNSIHDRTKQHLDFISKSVRAGSYVVNLAYSVFGANELGIDPLIALISSPYPTMENKESEIAMYANTERAMVNLLLTYGKKIRNLLKDYRDLISQRAAPADFYAFLSSDTDFQRILINRTTNQMLGSQTPLHYASSKGKTEVVEVLLKHGAPVNSLTHEGATALHLAALNGHLEVVKLLVNSRASLQLSLKTGETPLHLAIYGLHVDVVAFLVDLYRDQNLQSMKGPSLWHALVCGIFREDDQRAPKDLKEPPQPFENVIGRLSLAVEMAKLLVQKAETEKWLSTYVWANHLPSQLLQQLWDRAFESSSLFYFPKRAPTVYVVSNPRGVMESPMKTLQTPDSNGKAGLYGSLKASKYNVNNYNELNQKNDAVFSAARTFHFLVEIIKKMEEQCANLNQ